MDFVGHDFHLGVALSVVEVVSGEEEAKYLAVASEPLGSIATVLADTGMRPEECFRLRWEHVTWLNGRNGALLVAGSGSPLSQPRFGCAMSSLARITPSTMSSTYVKSRV